jgi:predicted phage-related endonuclease
MEPHLRDHLSEVLGVEVTDDPRMYYHPEYPTMLHANVDGIIDDPSIGKGIAEIKTTTSRRVSQLNTIQDIPDSWYYQIQHYLGILSDADFAYLMVFLRDTAQYLDPLKVPRDEEFIRSNNQSLANWWNRYVEADQPPPMANDEDLKIRYPSTNEGKAVEASDHIIRRYHALKQVKERLSDLKDLRQSIEMDLKTAMGDAEQLVHENELLATWKTQSRSRFDTTRFREEERPELYKEYTTENQYRVFRLK